MLFEQSSQRQILDSMTMVVKINKSILKEIQQHAKQAHSDGILRDQVCLQGLLNQLPLAAANIDTANSNPITYNRFMGRLLELLNFYKSKCSFQVTGNFMRDFIDESIRVIKSHFQQSNGNITSLFNKIALTIKIWLSQIKNKVTGQNMAKINPTPIAYSSIVSPTRTEIPKKTFQSRYKLTKEVINHMILYEGMNIDIQNLKSIFLQSRNNVEDLKEEGLYKNRHISKAIYEYSQGYAEWMKRFKNKKKKQKDSKKDKKSSKVSPVKKERDIENKYGQSKTPGLLGPMTTKLKPKTSQLSRTFIHLNEIKNQKFRRPYAEVKQVLVTGDEINYYSKNSAKQYQEVSRKPSYFMNRAIKVQNGMLRKRSVRQGERLVTQ